MPMKLLQKAVVEDTRLVSSRVRSIVLRHELRSQFQTFEAGAHVTLHLRDGIRRQYSLCGDPADPTRYNLGVLLEAESRGGSWAVHDLVVGSKIFISYPANSFALSKGAEHHVLVAGGIGVTPIIAMAYDLAKCGASFEVHYYGRSIAEMAFSEDLNAICPKGTLFLHPDDEPESRLDLRELVEESAPSSHVYCCGPLGMINAFKAAASILPVEQVHLEQFGKAATDGDVYGAAFELEIANTGEILQVAEDQTAIDVLRDRQIMVDYSCEGGVCGDCRQDLVSGDVDHRDSYLKPEERKDSVMLCVSRCAGRMVVNLPKNTPGIIKPTKEKADEN